MGTGRGLPGGRAVVGGLLVAVAAVVTFAAASGGQGPAARYLVAARDLPPGTIIRSEHLRAVPADLPSTAAAHAYRDRSSLVGRALLGATHRGELIQESQVGAGSEGAAAVVAIGLPRAEAVGGELVPGDRVDVYATTGDGADASTRLLGTRLQVVQVASPSSAIGASGDVLVHLAVSAEQQRLDLVHAAHAGSITLVRTTSANTRDPGGGTPEAEEATG